MGPLSLRFWTFTSKASVLYRIKVFFVCRNSNKFAQYMAKVGLFCSNEMVWMDIFPDWLSELVYSCSVLLIEYKYFLSTKEIETISSRLMTQLVLRLKY